MGDMIRKITGDHYKSSRHRVLNRNSTDRYSVVFFFDGNLDYKLRRLDNAGRSDDDEDALTAEEHMKACMTASYGVHEK